MANSIIFNNDVEIATAMGKRVRDFLVEHVKPGNYVKAKEELMVILAQALEQGERMAIEEATKAIMNQSASRLG